MSFVLVESRKPLTLVVEVVDIRYLSRKTVTHMGQEHGYAPVMWWTEVDGRTLLFALIPKSLVA